MNCQKLQDWMLTDYIDAQIDEKRRNLIDEHLAQCHVCHDFLTNLRHVAVDPFINASQAVPDEFLWARIKQEIETQEIQTPDKSLISHIWEKLRSTGHVPRPAFALATMVTIIFMIGSTGQLFMNTPFVKVNGPEQVEYLSSLIDEPMDMADNNGNDPQTPIETYFL